MQEVFGISQSSSCGGLEFAFFSDDPAYSSFLSFDKVEKIVKIEPFLADLVGYYDQAFIQFFLVDHPDLYLDVKIKSTVQECRFETVVFESTFLKANYTLG